MLPLVIFVVFACVGLAQELRAEILLCSNAPTLLHALAALSTTSIMIFAAQQALLCLIRRPPLARAEGFRPRIAAFASAYAGLLMLLVGRERLGELGAIISVGLSVLGTIGAIWVLSWLGRSFSIFPQARALVTRGPYRMVRHPLYLMEGISIFGISLQFKQPGSFVVFFFSVSLMLVRMNYEEDVLIRTFPGYAFCRRATWRIIPYIY